jgi:hypothetical protein
MLLEYTHLRDPLYYTDNERQALKDERIPLGNIWIWAGRYVGEMTGCQEQSHVLFRSPRVNGHLSTTCVRQLVLQVLLTVRYQPRLTSGMYCQQALRGHGRTLLFESGRPET